MNKRDVLPQPSGESSADQPSELTVSTLGLSSEEAEELLEQYGYNEITKKKTYAIIKLLKFFWGPIPVML